MASKWPPVKNSGFTFRVFLFAQADDQILTSPTIAAGDFQVSKDGGAFANLGTTPSESPSSSGQVLITLSSTEMNADEVVVRGIDAAGDEWHSQAWTIHTVGQTFDTVDGNVDSILADTGTDGVVLANDAITSAKFDESTAFPQSGDAFARLGAPAGASVSADIAAIEAQTDDIGAAGAGLTAIPWNSAWDAEVQSEATDALNAYDPPTKAELDSGLAGLNDPAASAIADAVWDEAIAGHAGAGSTGAALAGASAPTAAAVADAVWEEAIGDHSGTVGSTAEALDAAGGGVTAAAVADAVWDEALADHQDAGSTGLAIYSIPGAVAGAIEYTYTVDDGSNPIEGAEVWISTDEAGSQVIWYGTTDASGVALASNNEKPWLDAGTYYAWVKKGGYSFSNPDELTVS